MPIPIHVCIICVPIQWGPRLNDTDVTTVQAVERLGLGSGLGLGSRVRFELIILAMCYGMVLECTIRFTVRFRVGVG